MRADICGSLFNGAPQQATLTAMQRYNSTKEVVIYDSLVWDNFEHANFTDTMKMAEQYARRYPELQNEYEKEFALQNENDEDDDRYFIAFIEQHSMYDKIVCNEDVQSMFVILFQIQCITLLEPRT